MLSKRILCDVRATSANQVTFAFGENRDCDVSGCHGGEGIKEGGCSLMRSWKRFSLDED